MKTQTRALFVVLAIIPLLAGNREPARPNPADYTVVLHVGFSRTAQTTFGSQQQLQAEVDGQPLELVSGCDGILAPGDYKARYYLRTSSAPKNRGDYDLFPGYDVLLPDGTSRGFAVTGLGLKPNPAAHRN
jgi:hypothetical protein